MGAFFIIDLQNFEFFHKSPDEPKGALIGGKATFGPMAGLVEKISKFCRLVRT